MPHKSNPAGNAVITPTTERSQAPVAFADLKAVVVRAPHYVEEGERPSEFDSMRALTSKLVQVPKAEVDEKRKKS